MSIADRLDQIEARANAATEGPWVVDDTDEGWMVIQDPEVGIEPMTPEDADLMAAARTDVPALVAALRAVLEEIEKRKHTVGDRLTLADVLPRRIEEKLS